jgi:hypothetical protein
MDAIHLVHEKLKQFHLETTVGRLEDEMMFRDHKLPDSAFISSVKFEGIPILPPVVSVYILFQ